MRRILVILALGLVVYVLRRLGRERARPAGPAPPGESLVRDRICNTFLPPGTAVRLDHGGTLHYFCSAACRDRFLEKVR